MKEKLAGLAPGTRILDAGAGSQQYRPYCSHLEYVAQDFGEYDGFGDGTGLHPDGTPAYETLDIKSDITSIPLPDENFGAILCTEVLEHVPSPELALKELCRLLKPDGTLILTAPFCSLTHLAPYHFYTGFSRYFYEYQFDKLGLEIVEMTSNGDYFKYLGQELTRLDSAARRYGGHGLGIFGKALDYALLLIVGRIEKRQSGSAELLCFGYHVQGRKRKIPA